MTDNVNIPDLAIDLATDEIAGVHYQVAKMAFGAPGTATPITPTTPLPAYLIDKNGVALDSLAAGGSNANGQLSALGATYFFASTNNSTSTQLAAAATFTGVVETIYNAQSISILLVSDQPGTLTLKQYIDAGGTQVISSWAIPITAGVPFSRNFVGNGNYFNLTFTNSGGSPTTTLVIHTAYGILPAATNLGNAPVSLDEVGGTALTLGIKAATASLPVSLPNDFDVTQAASIAAVNTNLLNGVVSGWYDAANFHSVSMQVIGGAGISAGAIIFEETNDIVNAASGNIWKVEEDGAGLTPTPQVAAITIAASAVRMFKAAVTCRYVRVRVSTAFVGGTVKVAAIFSQLPYVRMVQTVHQATAGNFNATIAAIPAGTSAIGDVGLQARANATGAMSTAKVLTAASTNATLIKATAGRVTGYQLTNTTASVKVVHMHNLSVAPTVGTSSPTYSIVIPANSSVEYSNLIGIGHSTGISYSITTGIADLDATATAVGDVIGSIHWS